MFPLKLLLLVLDLFNSLPWSLTIELSIQNCVEGEVEVYLNLPPANVEEVTTSLNGSTNVFSNVSLTIVPRWSSSPAGCHESDPFFDYSTEGLTNISFATNGYAGVLAENGKTWWYHLSSLCARYVKREDGVFVTIRLCRVPTRANVPKCCRPDRALTLVQRNSTCEVSIDFQCVVKINSWTPKLYKVDGNEEITELKADFLLTEIGRSLVGAQYMLRSSVELDSGISVIRNRWFLSASGELFLDVVSEERVRSLEKYTEMFCIDSLLFSTKQGRDEFVDVVFFFDRGINARDPEDPRIVGLFYNGKKIALITGSFAYCFVVVLLICKSRQVENLSCRQVWMWHFFGLLAEGSCTSLGNVIIFLIGAENSPWNNFPCRFVAISKNYFQLFARTTHVVLALSQWMHNSSIATSKKLERGLLIAATLLPLTLVGVGVYADFLFGDYGKYDLSRKYDFLIPRYGIGLCDLDTESQILYIVAPRSVMSFVSYWFNQLSVNIVCKKQRTQLQPILRRPRGPLEIVSYWLLWWTQNGTWFCLEIMLYLWESDTVTQYDVSYRVVFLTILNTLGRAIAMYCVPESPALQIKPADSACRNADASATGSVLQVVGKISSSEDVVIESRIVSEKTEEPDTQHQMQI